MLVFNVGVFYSFYDSWMAFAHELWFRTQMKPQIMPECRALFWFPLHSHNKVVMMIFMGIFPHVRLNLNLFTAFFLTQVHQLIFFTWKIIFALSFTVKSIKRWFVKRLSSKWADEEKTQNNFSLHCFSPMLFRNFANMPCGIMDQVSRLESKKYE